MVMVNPDIRLGMPMLPGFTPVWYTGHWFFHDVLYNGYSRMSLDVLLQILLFYHLHSSRVVNLLY